MFTYTSPVIACCLLVVRWENRTVTSLLIGDFRFSQIFLLLRADMGRTRSSWIDCGIKPSLLHLKANQMLWSIWAWAELRLVCVCGFTGSIEPWLNQRLAYHRHPRVHVAQWLLASWERVYIVFIYPCGSVVSYRCSASILVGDYIRSETNFFLEPRSIGMIAIYRYTESSPSRTLPGGWSLAIYDLAMACSSSSLHSRNESWYIRCTRGRSSYVSQWL